MIKKLLFFSVVLALVAFSADGPYKDGYYNGTSRAIYTDEPYYGNAKVTIENGNIVKVEFFVRDSLKHEYFNDKYEKYFAGNDEYIRQCRNDWKGIQSYPDSLLKYQEIDKLDAISGATWSFNLFKASAQEALSAAVNDKH
jgi:major membrane immunogen (membrane-anchored lipoprotein)